jgi:hypothetical protein
MRGGRSPSLGATPRALEEGTAEGLEMGRRRRRSEVRGLKRNRVSCGGKNLAEILKGGDDNVGGAGEGE